MVCKRGLELTYGISQKPLALHTNFLSKQESANEYPKLKNARKKSDMVMFGWKVQRSNVCKFCIVCVNCYDFCLECGNNLNGNNFCIKFANFAML